MKTSKIATIIIIAALGATLIGASALAYLGTRATPTATTGTYGNYPAGMMNGYQTYPSTTTTTPPTQTVTTEIPPNDAATIARTYLNQTGNPNLAVKTVQEYTNTYYVQIVEKDSD